MAACVCVVTGIGLAVAGCGGAESLTPSGAPRPSLFGGVGHPWAEPAAIDNTLPAVATDPDEAAWDIPGEIVVDARDSLDSRGIADLARDFGLSFVPTALEPETHVELAMVPKGRMADLLASISRDPRVEAAEPLAYVRAFFAANDPLLKEQWHMGKIGAPRAWDFTTGRGVTVAVVDTGIACENYGPYSKGSDLSETTCVPGWNFVASNSHANDDQGHGTHVAGTIAQSTNNGLGAVGIAFHARLMPVKVLNENGWGTTADVADGIRWAAAHGADVINLSLGGPRNSKVLESAIAFARSRGTVVVAAAGNTGGRVQFPGASAGAIGVSATDADDKLATFSSRGVGVDIAAPGVNVVQQTICNRGRDKCERFPSYNGTSMASPHVAGAAALVMSLGVTDPSAVEAALAKGARVVDGSADGKKLYGAGVLQVADTVERVSFVHVLARLLALATVTALVARGVGKKKGPSIGRWGLGYWLFALVTGPGLFFFAPWVLPRVPLVVDLLARPLADYDLLLGTHMHRWLPLASGLVPFALTAIFFGARRLRPAIAGFAAGTATYLISVAALREAAFPFGFSAMVAYTALNVIVCLWIARTNLRETT